jgi:hypothetical protein
MFQTHSKQLALLFSIDGTSSIQTNDPVAVIALQASSCIVSKEQVAVEKALTAIRMESVFLANMRA